MEITPNTFHTQYNQKIFNPSIIGNIVSKEWRNLIVTKNNKPDRLGIDVYAYFVNWHLPKKIKSSSNDSVKLVPKFSGDAFSTCYKHLAKEFNCSIEHLRRVIVKLEQLGLLQRDFRDVVIKGRTYKNRLFIILNKQALHFNKSLKLKATLPSKEGDISGLLGGGGSPHGNGDYIDKTINIKTTNKLSLSGSSSEFLPNDFIGKEKINEKPHSDIFTTEISVAETRATQKNTVEQGEGAKKPAEYLPFTEEELEYIKIQSGRDYSITAIKKIREKIDWKIKHLFRSRNHLISYCIKFVSKEIASESELNRLDYNFRRDDELGKKVRAEELYLNKVEQCNDISPSSQLRRKIAGVFETSVAYQLLTRCRFAAPNDDLFKVTLSSALNLTELQREILEAAIKSIYGEIDIIYTELESRAGERSALYQEQDDEEVLDELDPNSAWYKVRRELQNRFDPIIDKIWFAKLKPEEDQVSGKILLKAPTSFVKSYIQQNYGLAIEECCMMLNYQFDRFYSIKVDGDVG